MLDYHSTGIQKFILDRLAQIHEEIVKDDPEIRELEEKPNELLKLIAAKLTPEDRKLLSEYEDNWIYPINRQDEIIYSEGLMDGIMFGYWVALVGRGVGKIGI
jgi:hypothetical protein